MPRQTKRYDLREVRDDLDDRLDELAADVQAADGVPDTLAAEANRVERHLAGVSWAVAEYEEPYVTVGALTAGEYAQVQDHVAEAQDHVGDSAGMGAQQIAMAAAGVVEGPFLDEDVPEGVAGFAQRREAVSDLPPQFVMWLETAVDEQTTPEVEVGNFAQRLADSHET